MSEHKSVPEWAKIVDDLALLCASAIDQVEDAEKDTNWGTPMFGPTYSEELESKLEDLHEPLADLFIYLSGKRRHASDCATSNAPAYLPRPCDCGTNVDRLAINLRAYAHSRGAPEREDDQEVAYEAAGDILKALAGEAK